MPRSDWRIIAALTGLVVLSGLVGAFVTALHYSEKQQERTVAAYGDANAGQNTPQQYLYPRSGIPAPVESVISNPQPSTGQDHEKRDLAAQEASAAFAWWMVVISFFGLCVTLIGTVLLYQQIRLTRDAVTDTGNATNAMIRQNELTEQTLRAYLTVDSPQVIRLQIGAEMQIQAAIANYGQTPSRKTKILVKLVVTEVDTGEQVFINNNNSADVSHSINPGQSHVSMTSGPIINFDNLQSLADAKASLELFVNFEYMDIFGRRYGVRSRYNYPAPRFSDQISALNCIAYEEYTPSD